MTRIGIFGGTFDPPHVAHLVLAAECLYQLGLDRILWVLTPNPPHKLGQEISPLPQRLELLQAALAGNPAFRLSRVDIDRPAPHYAVGTIPLLRAAFPRAELVYLIGGDSLHDLPRWFHPAELVEAVDAFGVMRRPGDAVDLPALERSLPGLASKTHFVDAPLLEISSTQIRARVAASRPYRYYLPVRVYRLIEARGYYRS